MESLTIIESNFLYKCGVFHCGGNRAGKLQAQYREQTVGPLSSATCPPIFMQLTVQSNGGIASPAFLLARKCN